jgi:hypothetical protein
MDKELCGKRNFEEEEEKIMTLTKSTLERAYPIYWTGVELVKDVINLLIEDTDKGQDESKNYSKAVLLLFNRSIQHIESIRLLTERGLYGDSFVLIRSLMSDSAMMQYLHFHPELVDLFLKENQDDYQENKDFKNAFNEGTLEKELVGKGITSFGSSFKILSKASHASAFGSQLYGSRGKIKGQYHFNYGPKFQAEKALLIIDMIAGSYYDLVSNVLWHRYHSKEDLDSNSWKKVQADLDKLKFDIDVFATAALATIKKMWPEGLN